eukprot:scaffold109408_cov72-Phaeocystis_antarctica.AAC.7
MNISSVFVSPCSDPGIHAAGPTDGHSEGGTAAAAAAGVPSCRGRALHTIMLEPDRARGEHGISRPAEENRWGTSQVRMVAHHGRSGGVLRRSVPRARACAGNKLAQPSAS